MTTTLRRSSSDVLREARRRTALARRLTGRGDEYDDDDDTMAGCPVVVDDAVRGEMLAMERVAGEMRARAKQWNVAQVRQLAEIERLRCEMVGQRSPTTTTPGTSEEVLRACRRRNVELARHLYRSFQENEHLVALLRRCTRVHRARRELGERIDACAGDDASEEAVVAVQQARNRLIMALDQAHRDDDDDDVAPPRTFLISCRRRFCAFR